MSDAVDPLVEAIAQRTATIVLDGMPAADPTAALTIAEAAKQLRVSTKTVRSYIAAGDLEAINLGPKTVRIKRSALADYLNSRCTHAS